MRKIKFSSINKRHLTLIGLIAIIAVAGYVNVTRTDEAVETLSTVEENDTQQEVVDEFTNSVMERDSKRSQSMQVYRDIIDNSNCDKETKDNAQKMLTLSAKYITDENTIEKSLNAKGVEKSVVYIDSDEVTIIVYDEKLDEVSVSKIKDIVQSVSGFTAEKIKIIENK